MKEYDATCSKVAKNLQQEANPGSGNIVRVSRARAALGRVHPLNDCSEFRPFIGQFRAQIPDIYKVVIMIVCFTNDDAKSKFKFQINSKFHSISLRCVTGIYPSFCPQHMVYNHILRTC